MRLPFWPRGGSEHPIYHHDDVGLHLVGKLVTRVLFAAFLVLGTYNPGGRSYYHWMRDSDAAPIWKVIATGLLLIGYGVGVPIIWRALGFGGIALLTVLATTASWVLVEAGWINLAAPDVPAWIALAVVVFVAGVGLTWMLFGRIFDGQYRGRDLTR